jgi:hypothetical protein
VSASRLSVLILTPAADVHGRWQRILTARVSGGLEVERLDPAGEWWRDVTARPALLLVEESRDGPEVWPLVERAISLGQPPDRIAVVLTSFVPTPERATSVLAVARPGEPESLNQLLLALDEVLS